MSTPLIGNVIIEPATPRPGETVKASVLTASGDLIGGTTASVWVNGAPGPLHYLQFPSTGERRISVTARNGSQNERRPVTIDVQGEPLGFIGSKGKIEIPMIGVTQEASKPYLAVFTVGSAVDVRAPVHLTPNSGSPILHLGPIKHAHAQASAGRTGTLATAMEAAAAAMTTIERPSLPATVRRPRSASGVVRERLGRSTAVLYDLGDIALEELLPGPTVTQAAYEWDFGDGHSKTTSTPTVEHDYFASLDHGAESSTFHLACRIVHANLTVRRTLTIASTYALCKRRGVIVPHVTSGILAEKRYLNLSAEFTLHNVEATPLVLDKMSVTPISADGEALGLPSPFVEMEQPVVIGPSTSAAVSINIPMSTGTAGPGELRYDVPGFAVVYTGHAGDLPVRCSAVFEVALADQDVKPYFPEIDLPPLVKKNWPWEEVEYDLLDMVTQPDDRLFDPAEVIVDRRTGTLAVPIGDVHTIGRTLSTKRAAALLSGAVYGSVARRSLALGRVPMMPLMQSRRGPAVASLASASPRVSFSDGVATLGTAFQVFDLMMSPPDPGPIAEGQICDPDHLSAEDLAAADNQQLVCQTTTEVHDVLMPARWMNARKGDCILSPGGDGMIGGLMLRVDPPQWYSHTGIMTRNYDEITHSTGSKDWLMDNLVGILEDGSDGFSATALRYVWPGAITQSVGASVDGEPFVMPWNGKSYTISTFGKHTVGVTHNDQMRMIPPLVLKPDPALETTAVRAALHAVASDARADAGRPTIASKYHYRWYCYTDPTIGLGAPAGPEATWAVGTRASVCSSYVWMKAKGRGAKLESTQALVTPTDLEPKDTAGGAAVRPVTPDGLYTYTAKERLNAGEWLYDEVYNQVFDKAGWFGNYILTDAADDTANQFLNTFANDDSFERDDDKWRQVQDADAISPDNMLWWDGPDTGGLYGFFEPAIYREPRIESYTVSRWKKVLSRGTIRGRVTTSAGVAVAAAMVYVYEGKSTFTGADGSYELKDVPLGSYLIKASKVIDGVLQAAQVSKELSAADTVVDIVLQMPSDRFRIAQVFVDFWGRDDEGWFEDDEIHDPGPEYYELELGPDKLVNSKGLTYKWGGEMRVEYTITVRLLVNNVIDVAVKGLLYEGTDESNDDLDGQGDVTFLVGVDQTQGATLIITNTDEDDPDEGRLSISVKNVRNNN